MIHHFLKICQAGFQFLTLLVPGPILQMNHDPDTELTSEAKCSKSF